jgi:arabinose-5-phosphate isomerase
MMKETAKRVLRLEAKAIEDLADRIDDRFIKAVNILAGCKGRVVVTGMGKSGLVGKKIAATLASTGTPAFFLHPAEGIHGDLGMVARGDVVLALSNSGETEELIRILPVFRRLAVVVVCLTGNAQSTLGKNSDLILDVGVSEEAGPFGMIPTASTAACMAMGDALAVALLENRGLNKEDFASFHPGGSLGRKLLVTVGDVMHGGNAVPVVRAETIMKDVILEISSKKLGMTTVQDAQGQLIGVITDGDLRRLLERHRDPLDLKAEEVMSSTPRVTTEDALAAKAVQLMEEYEITSLVVVRGERQAVGVVHLHDLLKMGIV